MLRSFKIWKKRFASLSIGISATQNNKPAFTLAEVLITLGIIGVVAAMTLPIIVGKYQKMATVNQLKKAYSGLYQAIERAKVDYGDIENWGNEVSTGDYVKKYILPYMKNIKTSGTGFTTNYKGLYTIVLADGTQISLSYQSANSFCMIVIDLNGEKKPNQLGKDRFSYYIFPTAKQNYNGGNGDIARNVPSGGLYPDGYGMSRDSMRNYSWRGCVTTAGTNPNNEQKGAFCSALIMHDGWEIKDDYPW